METTKIRQIMEQYGLDLDAEAFGNGHINDTYRVCGQPLVLQRINTSVFQNPDGLMENIEKVTSFLRRKIAAEGGDPERETLRIVHTKDGKPYYRTDENHVFRMYKLVEGTMSIEDDKTPEGLYKAGKGFGHFLKLLNDFPVEELHETIPDFHHTPKRVEALKQAIAEDRAGRAKLAASEIAFALEQAKWADRVVKGLEDGNIPSRVTHNDTKINNILFDEVTGEAVCVIDLDTVMPGSMLYDFGDALRMGASTAAEDETDLDQVCFSTEAFLSFARGYLEEMREELTETELELLPFSVKLLTYECGIRFLTDYLNGDTYFKIHRENHNLDRARNQFKLVAEISRKEAVLQEMVKTL
ncbi:MAG: aminoglycoside phosphotransferase family protein [Lachnospiraceae bacterium]|nr:aminoglycoside phosphotransferase family protein [Lachnospiraceae bacterium]